MNRIIRADRASASEGAAGHRPKDRAIVRIHLLGPMAATTYLGANVLPHGSRARALLAYLCLAGGEHVSRIGLARLLWDRSSSSAARANLRQALRELSSAFGKFSQELIVSGRDILRLNIDLCWVDALAVFALDPATLNAPYRDLKVLCRGELLRGLDGMSASFDHWLLAERVRITERLQLLLERELENSGKKRDETQALKRALADIRELVETLRAGTLRNKTRQMSESHVPSAQIEPQSRKSAATATANQQRVHAPDGSAANRDRVRVGVLAFLAHGSQREEDLAFSLSQEIAAGLARFRWFDVIAPIALQPSVRFIDEHQLRAQGLDYIIDGGIASDGKNVRINVRLMDLAERVRPVWSESFEMIHDELHRLDELVTSRIVSRIDPVILFIEGRPKRREHHGATGLLLLAMPMIFSMEPKKYEQAGELITRSLEIEPDN